MRLTPSFASVRFGSDKTGTATQPIHWPVGNDQTKTLPAGTQFTVDDANAKGEIPIQPKQPIAGFEGYEFPAIALDKALALD